MLHPFCIKCDKISVLAAAVLFLRVISGFHWKKYVIAAAVIMSMFEWCCRALFCRCKLSNLHFSAVYDFLQKRL